MQKLIVAAIVRVSQCLACLVVAACGAPSVPNLAADASLDDAAAPPQFPSCVGLAATCGPHGTDSCCTSLAIPGGTYYRSYDVAGDTVSGDKNSSATVSSFRLDKYEVTVGRFRAFANAGLGTQASPPLAGSGAHAAISGSGWDASWNTSLATDTADLVATVKCNGTTQPSTWTDAPGGNENRPMNCITWYEAMAFCAWDDGYLPTEAEWNYAATGGDEQRAYPWSNPPGDLTKLDSSYTSYFDGTKCDGDGLPGCELTDMVPVGSKPLGDGRWGQSDLGGNVNEWTLDSYATSYQVPCLDCANLTPATNWVFRGGSFLYSSRDLRAGHRGISNPGTHYTRGVRCARPL